MTLPSYLWHPSPNFNARAPNINLDYIILHYTGMRTPQEALDRMCDLQAQVSAHYMIDQDGTITHLIKESMRAWHAGLSSWQSITDMNSASIGIELVNPGHEFGYSPFPPTQIQSLLNLLRDLFTRHPFTAASVLGHSDIAPTRKQDPGELFPWPELAQNGFGLWPTPQDIATTSLSFPPKDPTTWPEIATNLLRTIGYEVKEETQSLPTTLQAFHRHYAPKLLEKGLSQETINLLKTISNLKSGTN